MHKASIIRAAVLGAASCSGGMEVSTLLIGAESYALFRLRSLGTKYAEVSDAFDYNAFLFEGSVRG